MTDRVRLIIPLWGSVYAEKLVSMTLPALLAPGNLPSLATMFDVEVVLVTESKLVDYIRQARSFQRLSAICQVKFASLDDLMPCEPGEYGVVLTTALFRGFVDLGAKATEAFLLFLNADFIIADGSYRRLAELMREGKRVIHAPSFRVVLEEAWPQLAARVDESGVLAVKPREMAKLALSHKHLTVKARTVNQRLYHQWCMDQFYWYVDEQTLVGYQWPVALVAIKPERVITQPVLVWDFGYLPRRFRRVLHDRAAEARDRGRTRAAGRNFARRHRQVSVRLDHPRAAPLRTTAPDDSRWRASPRYRRRDRGVASLHE
jgi:hypothetical protein